MPARPCIVLNNLNMKFSPALLFLSIVSLFLFSCQKERSFAEDDGNSGGTGGSVELNGTWRFVGMVAQTGSDMTLTEFGSSTRTLSVLDYTSINPTGTVSFSGNTMKTTNIGYDMEGETVMSMYEDGVLLMEQTVDAEGTVPPTSGNSSFTRIGSDSLRFNGMPIVAGAPAGMNPPAGTVNMGARYRMSNDTLYMRFRFDDDLPMPDPSFTGTMRIFGDMTIALKK